MSFRDRMHGDRNDKPASATVWIALSIALILFSGSIIAIPLGIAALVFALRIRSAQNAGDTESALQARRSCGILLIVGLAAAIVSGTVGLTALLRKYT